MGKLSMNKKISLDIKKKRGYNTRIEGKGAVNQHLCLLFLFLSRQNRGRTHETEPQGTEVGGQAVLGRQAL